ncbi:MAG: BON domain-containing protein [Nitrospirae bacterium]|nr:BON domain-containing protein [Candidatus Manganitrophaceae bacterium]
MKTIHLFTLTAALAALLISAAPLHASTDDRIESDVRKSYVFKNYLKDDAIEVHAKNGVVTLVGTVAEEHHRSLAELTIALLPDVERVDNQLKLKGGDEAWLVTSVKSALLFNRNLNARKTKVDAENGIVTLQGEAASETERDLIAQYVKEVKGVKAVINQMTVTSNGVKNVVDNTTVDGARFTNN